MDWQAIRTAIRIALYISIGIFIASLFLKDKLPPKKYILDEIYQEPRQYPLFVEPFETTVDKIQYTIDPLYGYDLYGLVVSQHDTAAWWDYYHKKWSDTLNIKDLCVIWGGNIRPEVYPRMKFHNGSWTCYVSVRPGTGEQDWAKFRMDSLSNNHLLSDDPDTNRIIRSVRKGDQVYLRGYLSQYFHSEGAFSRGTSITRDDTGGGACETIYITDFEILKRANNFWWFIHSLSKYMIVLAVIGLVVVRIVAPLGI